MKLISLNVWGGKIYQPLIKFLKENSKDTDILCFQEVFSTSHNITVINEWRLNLYQEISKILNSFKGYFAPCLNNYLAGGLQIKPVDFSLSWGLAIFVNKKITVNSHNAFFVYGTMESFNPEDLNTIPRNIQYINFNAGGRKFTVYNIHGIWDKSGKGDTSSRIQQSIKIKNLLKKQSGRKLLCGDFNLNINTKSIKILEENMTNLIKEYNTRTTRNSLFPGSDKYADYTFVSKEVNIKSFEVPGIDISDHLPMILEFS